MMDVNQPSEMELPGNVSELHSAVQESSTPTSSSNMAANLPHPSDYSLLPSRSAAGYTGSFTEEYRMESDPRGLLLIINNRDFGGHMSNRDGSDIDCDSLKTLFLKFGFGVDVRHNLTIQEIKNSLSLLSRLDQLKTVDCLAVAILTHGSEEVIYGVDCRHMRVHDAFTPFKAENCPALHHKPKFFIVNACRGDTEDKGSLSYSVDNVTGNVTTDVEAMNSAVLTTDRIPNLKDFLIAYSTIPGHVSWRHLNDGSWFIQGLVKVFSEMAHYKDVLTMLVKVNNEVSRNVSNAGVQIPAPQVMLTKTWYLNPITKPTL